LRIEEALVLWMEQEGTGGGREYVLSPKEQAYLSK
jgi:hypothetical protein